MALSSRRTLAFAAWGGAGVAGPSANFGNKAVSGLMPAARGLLAARKGFVQGDAAGIAYYCVNAPVAQLDRAPAF